MRERRHRNFRRYYSRVHAQTIAIGEGAGSAHACTIRFALAHGEHVPNSKTREKRRGHSCSWMHLIRHIGVTTRRGAQCNSRRLLGKHDRPPSIGFDYSPPSFVSWIYRVLISLPIKLHSPAARDDEDFVFPPEFHMNNLPSIRKFLHGDVKLVPGLCAELQLKYALPIINGIHLVKFAIN